MRKLTQQEFEEKVNELNPNLVVGTYINNRSPVYAKCKVCGHEWNPRANTLMDKKHLNVCPNCNHARITAEEFYKYFNDNYYGKYKLINLIVYEDGFINKKDSITVECKNCGHVFNTTYNRIKQQGCGCSVCYGTKALKGFNDMWTTNPEIASLLLNPDDGYRYTKGSSKLLEWKCPICGKTKISSPYVINKYGLSCSICGDNVSYPEKFVMNVFKQLDIDFETQITKNRFDWCGIYKYDFYIFDINTIVETHGEQHYTGSFSRISREARTLEEERENDLKKEMLAKENGILNYIVLDCRKSEMEWIKNSIMNSPLPQLLSFKEEDVDWILCEKEARCSLVYKVSNLINDGKLISEIEEELKISDSTIWRYMNIGKNIGICNDELYKTLLKNKLTNSISNRTAKRVRCKNNGKEFDKIRIAAEKYGSSYKSIKNAAAVLSRHLNHPEKYPYFGKDEDTGEKLIWEFI